jgi:hypothetical protein
MSAALIARSAENPTDLAVRFINILSELQLDEVLDVDLQGALHKGKPFTVSRPSADGNFVVPETAPVLPTGRAALTAFEAWLKNVPGDERPEIDPAFEVIGFVPDFTVLAAPEPAVEEEDDDGEPLDATDPYGSEGDGEFLNLTWSGIGDERGMTAVILPRVRRPVHESFEGLTSGGAIGGGRWWLRTDVRACAPEGKAGGGSLLILRVRNGKG